MKKTVLLVSFAAFASLAAAPGSSAPAAPASPVSPADNLTQSAWARMLVDRLGLTQALPTTANGDEVAVAVLGGRGPAITREGAKAQLAMTEGTQKTWRYEVTVPRTAIWLLTTRNEKPAFVGVDKQASALTAASPAGGTSDVGQYPLVGGAHVVTVTSTQAQGAPDVSLVSGCSVVAPAGGWSPNTQLSYGVLARTLVQAMRQNARLPAAEALAAVPVKTTKVMINAPSEGTYTVLFSGKALDRASYRMDGCEETRVLAASTADGWREGATAVLLDAGEHAITLTGMDAAKGDGRIRLVRRTTSDDDYLSVLQAMGVKLSSLASAPSRDAAGERHARVAGSIRLLRGNVEPGLANRIVTRGEALRILNSAVIARHLARGGRTNAPPGDKGKPVPPEYDLPESGTFPVPISPVVPGNELPDPL